jgi:hypothetical protein
MELIEITNISDKLKKLAYERAKNLPKLTGTFTANRAGVPVGYMGQIIFAEYVQGDDVDEFNFDVVKNGIRYEVKSKNCTGKPKGNFICSVATANAKQKCDYYVFVRVLKDFSKAWILGQKSPEDFKKQAMFWKKGQLDPTDDRGYIVKTDSYNMEANKLDTLNYEIQTETSVSGSLLDLFSTT